MIATWLIASSTLGLAVLGAFLWKDICEEIGRALAERRDRTAEIEFLKISDDELAAVILSDLRREVIMN